MRSSPRISIVSKLALILLLIGASEARAADRIRPWAENPRYWEWKGKPVLLLGGSKDDNLFQIPDLEAHLDEMRATGANYIRNTMSDRPDKGFETYPFAKLENGKYDLDRWNEEYWKRFETMLRLTEERGIFVQIEIWDRFDYSDLQDAPNWSRHPYNPKNNVNYTEAESGLAPTYSKHPGANEQPFFFTVPTLRNNEVVLRRQRAFVDKLLACSLPRGNVLYCMDNETSGREEWSAWWAGHVRDKARAAGLEVYLTEMWDAWNLQDPTHRRTFDHPELYGFVDVSQNNHNKGEAHWKGLQWVRERLADRPRPMNCVKIYGADGGRFGNTRDGLERFWRNIFGGAASSRFHRPTSGLGLGEEAKSHLSSSRLLEAEYSFFEAVPDAGGKLLGEREENEAYASYVRGERFAVYFPDGGSVKLDLSGCEGRFTVRWLEIEKGAWREAPAARGGDWIPLAAPAKGPWACLVKKAK